MMTDEAPIRGDCTIVDPAHIHMIRFKGRPLGIESEGLIDTDHIDGVFSDDEEFEIQIENDKLYLKMGKNVYWFPIIECTDYSPKVPPLEKFKTMYEVDPSSLAKSVKGNKGGDYVRLVATCDRNKQKTVFAFVYSNKGELIGGIDLKTPWDGKESIGTFPAEYIEKWKGLGSKAKVQMKNNYPIELVGSDEGVEYYYILAPRVDQQDDGSIKDEEKEWIASHNKRFFKKWKR